MTRLTIGFSTKEINNEFIDELKKSSGIKDVEIIPFENKGTYSLTEAYNIILNKASHDIVVLCHDDIYFDTKNWGRKILKHFKRNPEYGILGVAGSTKLPKTAKWWESRRTMRGIVNHENNGNKWESKYSDNIGNQIDDVVLVDGVFIVVNKNKIAEKFNEDVKGFHFYDVDFSFNNYTKNTKIGVIYDVRLTHKSIGETNDEWENNRKSFAEKNADKLPIKIEPNITIDSKIKVLMSGLFFKTFTGSEMYMYELSKELVKLNCDVTVLSDINGELAKMANREGIKTLSLSSHPPGYIIGDGNIKLNTPTGLLTTEPNKLYRTSDVNFDIIHVQHKPITERIIQLYPEIPKIATIHSEVISLENPVIDETIHKYIAIRPEIKDKIVSDGIDTNMVEVIYNPINTNKFNTKNITEGNYILFVGTIDYLRKNTIYDVANYARTIGKEFWLVGENKANYLGDLVEYPHVKHFPPTNKVEDFVKRAYETAGILLGRTTIESWLCGKNSWIYDVDSDGNIKNKTLTTPPEDLEKFTAAGVAKRIKNEYVKILKEL